MNMFLNFFEVMIKVGQDWVKVFNFVFELFVFKGFEVMWFIMFVEVMEVMMGKIFNFEGLDVKICLLLILIGLIIQGVVVEI